MHIPANSLLSACRLQGFDEIWRLLRRLESWFLDQLVHARRASSRLVRHHGEVFGTTEKYVSNYRFLSSFLTKSEEKSFVQSNDPKIFFVHGFLSWFQPFNTSTRIGKTSWLSAWLGLVHCRKTSTTKFRKASTITPSGSRSEWKWWIRCACPRCELPLCTKLLGADFTSSMSKTKTLWVRPLRFGKKRELVLLKSTEYFCCIAFIFVDTLSQSNTSQPHNALVFCRMFKTTSGATENPLSYIPLAGRRLLVTKYMLHQVHYAHDCGKCTPITPPVGEW